MKSLSVVIPTYREEEYIRKTLDSIKSQSYDGDVEIIVADYDPDGRGLTRDAVGDDAMIVNVDRKGIGYARRMGCAAATGEVIMNMDADAVFTSSTDMATLVKYATEPGARYSHCPIVVDGEWMDALSGHILVGMLNVVQFVLPQGWEPGLTMTKETYNSVGGFQQDGVMEGAALCTALVGKYGIMSRRYVTDVKILVSNRRYRAMDFDFNNAYREKGKVNVD